MDLWDVAKVMWRRRWVAAPLLLLSVVAAVFALLTVPPDYTAKGQIAVLPPSQATGGARPGETTLVNPYTPDTLAEFVAISLNRPEVKRQMFAAGFSVDYEVTMKGFGLTIIDILVSAKTNAQVTATLHRLIEMIQSEFQRHQINLKPLESITTNVIDEGEEIKVVRTVGKRTLIVIVGVGVLVTVAVSLWVDALIRRRSLRMPDLPEARAAVPISPAVGVASAMPPPVVYTSPNAANASTVPLDGDGPADNDSTVVLPLAGVSWAGTSTKKNRPGGKNR
jgi:Chain length determinant protein